MLNQHNDEQVVELGVKVEDVLVVVVVVAGVEDFEVFYLMMVELVVGERLSQYVKQQY